MAPLRLGKKPKPSLNFRSLQGKIILVCILVLVTQSIFVYLFLRYSSVQAIADLLHNGAINRTRLIQGSIRAQVVENDRLALENSLALFIETSLMTDAIVVDCRGTIYASGTPLPKNEIFTDAFSDMPQGLHQNLLADDDVREAVSNSNGSVYYTVAPLPCPSDSNITPAQEEAAALVIRSDFAPKVERENSIFYQLAVIHILISGLFILCGALILHGYFSRKLGSIAYSIDEFSSGNPNHRYKSQGSDEIDSIGEAFNKMADTIQKQLVRIQNTNRRLVLTDKVFELSSSGVAILSEDFVILDVNPAFVDINGYQLHEVVGKHFDFLSHDISEDERLSTIEEAAREGSAYREFWVRAANGKRFRKSLRLSPMRNSEDEITHYFLIESNITDDYMQRLQLQTLATTDSLTGLKNRRQFEIDSTNIKLTDAGCCAVAAIDLDGLKEINTKYGHLAGDRFIEIAGRRLSEQVENMALGVYRLGGDEFCVILNHPGNNSELTRICRAIMAAVEGGLKIDLIDADLTIGLGVSIYDPTRHQSIQDIIKESDIALKEAKRFGRSSFLIATEQALAAHERKTNISLALKSPALDEQVQVAYLPKVDIQNNILSGAEALIRWTSPDLGFVLNDEFIPIAEETGDILKIDEWVMRRAISDAALFGRLIDGFQTTINVSPRQLFESHYSEELIHQLEISKVDAENFSVEITEWTAIQHYERFIPVLNSLRSAGISVELDDFGTGHSSLVNLHKLPVDALKVDRNFVHSMVDNRVSLEIVRSVILLARSLKMTVIAEGVENVTQLEILRELGCDYCQGYLYSEPIIVENEEGLRSAIAQWEETIQSLL